MKRCSKCYTLRHTDDYHKDASRLDGRSYVCKQCHNERSRLYSKSHENERESYRIEYHYGINTDELFDMLLSQDGKCATCQCSITLERKHTNRAHIDHDHRTGKVRELLCKECNKALGLIKEDKDTLMNMIAYIDKHNE